MVKQLNLFKSQSLNVSRAMKECVARVVAESGMSRIEFLDQLNLVAGSFGIRLMKGNGSELTMATFEKWLNVKSLGYMPPLVAIPVICEVGNTLEPLEILAGALGGEMIDEQRKKRLMWADAYMEEKEARMRKKLLEADI